MNHVASWIRSINRSIDQTVSALFRAEKRHPPRQSLRLPSCFLHSWTGEGGGGEESDPFVIRTPSKGPASVAGSTVCSWHARRFVIAIRHREIELAFEILQAGINKRHLMPFLPRNFRAGSKDYRRVLQSPPRWWKRWETENLNGRSELMGREESKKSLACVSISLP